MLDCVDEYLAIDLTNPECMVRRFPGVPSPSSMPVLNVLAKGSILGMHDLGMILFEPGSETGRVIANYKSREQFVCETRSGLESCSEIKYIEKQIKLEASGVVHTSFEYVTARGPGAASRERISEDRARAVIAAVFESHGPCGTLRDYRKDDDWTRSERLVDGWLLNRKGLLGVAEFSLLDPSGERKRVPIKSLDRPSSTCLGWFLIEATRRSDDEVDFEIGLIDKQLPFRDLALYSFTFDELNMQVRNRHDCRRFFIRSAREGCYVYLGRRRLAIGRPKRERNYGLVEVIEIPTRESQGQPPVIAVGFLDDSPQGLMVLRGDGGSFLVVDSSPLGEFGQLTWFRLPDGW